MELIRIEFIVCFLEIHFSIYCLFCYLFHHYILVLSRIHITAAPLFLVMTILHYNRAILYACPSLLYYASTTIPTYVESWMSRRRHCQGTRIISITKIPTLSNNDQHKGLVLDITFAASPEAMEQFRPGHYCTLHVPSLSLVAHPFTVNLVPGYNDRLRILMRQVGPFTTQLANILTTNSQYKSEMNDEEEVDLQLSNPCTTSLPPMQINGFHGVPHRMDQLQQHDAVALIAGGIGITPHLSMLMKLITMSCDNNEDDLASLYSFAPLKLVELHWMCRDDSLIRYIHEHYFLSMLQHCPKWSSKGCQVSFKIIVHYTGKTIETSNDPSSLLPFEEPTIVFLEQPSSSSKKTRGIGTNSTTHMTPSHFSVGEQKDIHQNAFKSFSPLA